MENLLNEFNYPSTSNGRKHEIEKQLIDFQNNIQSWPQCLFQLQNSTSNQFVWFFNVSTIETTIAKKWKYLEKTDRMRMRDTLWHYYVNMSAGNVPRIQREKIAQVITLMGKREFPKEHDKYMSNIVNLLETKFPLGIILLRATSEELMSTRDDISSDRKKDFQSSVSMCMPEVFQLLTQFLTIYAYAINGADLELASNSGLVDQRLIESLPKDNVNRFNASAIELLTCIQHLLSWAPLDELVHEQFLMRLFDLSSFKENHSDISVAALNTITELFYVQRALHVIGMASLHVIVNGIKNILIQPRLDTADEQYQDKLTELLRLFIAQQWSKWIDDEQIFPEIVSGLYSYTFSSCAPLAFTEKLGIWHPIISGLTANGFNRYTPTMHLLVSAILHKIQFRFDPDLKILDNECLDDDVSVAQSIFLDSIIYACDFFPGRC